MLTIALMSSGEWTVVKNKGEAPKDAAALASSPEELEQLFEKETMDRIRMTLVTDAQFSCDKPEAARALWMAMVVCYETPENRHTRGARKLTKLGGRKYTEPSWSEGYLYELTFNPNDSGHRRTLKKHGAAVHFFLERLMNSKKKLFTYEEILDEMRTSEWKKSPNTSWERWVVCYVCYLKSMGFIRKKSIVDVLSRYPKSAYNRARGG